MLSVVVEVCGGTDVFLVHKDDKGMEVRTTVLVEFSCYEAVGCSSE